MRWAIPIVAASAAVAATPSAAQQQRGFGLNMGQEISFTLEPAEIRSPPTPTEPNAFERESGVAFSRGDYQEAMGTNSKAMYGETPTVAPNLIRARFTPIAGSRPGSLLVIQNGYDRALVWHALIKVRGKTSPSDVCLVVPGKTGVEHWPYPIETIVMTDLQLVPWKPEDGVRCE